MNVKRILAVAALVGISPLHTVAADDDAPMVSLQRLSLETAMSIAKGAVEKCRTEYRRSARPNCIKNNSSYFSRRFAFAS